VHDDQFSRFYEDLQLVSIHQCLDPFLDTANLSFFLSIVSSPYVLMVYASRVGSVRVPDLGVEGSAAGFSKALSIDTSPSLYT